MSREYRGEDVDALIALHARRSARAALTFRRTHPGRPLVVVLTGTDIYRDLPASKRARRALAAATAIVTLQPEALRRIPKRWRGKARSIIQSARRFPRSIRHDRRRGDVLRVSVIGHLRPEKDPLRTAYAVRSLPKAVAVQVTQAGKALVPRLGRAAQREMQRNERYRWLGALGGSAARRLLCSSDLMVISSLMEGGANVVSEAIACDVPIIASRVPGNVGILGKRYPGLYPARNTGALASLIRRAALRPGLFLKLNRAMKRLRPLIEPHHERRQWIALVRELVDHEAQQAS